MCKTKLCCSSSSNTYLEGSDWNLSFYQFLPLGSVLRGDIAIRILFKKNYSNLLKRSKSIGCGSTEWRCEYDNEQITGLQDLMKKFDVEKQDTVIVTVNLEGKMCARIFQVDGMEINYAGPRERINYSEQQWYMFDEWATVIEEGEEENKNNTITVGENENGHNEIPEMVDGVEGVVSYKDVLVPSNLDGKCHGMYLNNDTIKPYITYWKIGDILTLERADGKKYNLRLVLSNGELGFSAGWSIFCRKNKLKLRDTIEFSFNPNADFAFQFTIKRN